MSSIGSELGRQALHHLFALYAIVVMTHFGLQIAFAHRAYRAALRARAGRSPLEQLPTVDFIITSYNEEPDRLEACLHSLVDQDYPGKVQVFVVDDYSQNRRELLPIYESYARLPGWSVFLARENRGKRAGQDV